MSKQELKETKRTNFDWLFLIRGILLIVAGLFAFARPGGTLMAVALFLGISVLIGGVLDLISYIRRYHTPIKTSAVFLIDAILDIVLGIILLLNSASTASALPILAGVLIIISAIVKFCYAYKFRHISRRLLMLTTVSSLLSIFVGIMFFINPFAGALTIVYFLGIYLVTTGIVSLVYSFE